VEVPVERAAEVVSRDQLDAGAASAELLVRNLNFIRLHQVLPRPADVNDVHKVVVSETAFDMVGRGVF
jgi:hypothetical protein